MITINNQLQTNRNSISVTYTNMGAYLGYALIEYNFVGGFGFIETPFVPVLQSSTVQLPAGINTLFITLYKAVYLQVSSAFQTFTFPSPTQNICITSFGSLFYAWGVNHPCTGLGSQLPSLAAPPNCCAPNTCCNPSCGPVLHPNYVPKIAQFCCSVCNPLINNPC